MEKKYLETTPEPSPEPSAEPSAEPSPEEIVLGINLKQKLDENNFTRKDFTERFEAIREEKKSELSELRIEDVDDFLINFYPYAFVSMRNIDEGALQSKEKLEKIYTDRVKEKYDSKKLKKWNIDTFNKFMHVVISDPELYLDFFNITAEALKNERKLRDIYTHKIKQNYTQADLEKWNIETYDKFRDEIQLANIEISPEKLEQEIIQIFVHDLSDASKRFQGEKRVLKQGISKVLFPFVEMMPERQEQLIRLVSELKKKKNKEEMQAYLVYYGVQKERQGFSREDAKRAWETKPKESKEKWVTLWRNEARKHASPFSQENRRKIRKTLIKKQNEKWKKKRLKA